MPNIRKSADAPCATCGKHKPYTDYYKSKLHANGRESRCKECCKERSRDYKKEHPLTAEFMKRRSEEWRSKNIERNRIYQAEWQLKKYRALRRFAIDHYGAVCKCCGEKEFEFLCIDHVNGGGGDHRRAMGWGGNIYRWLKKEGYPSEGFQVLCHNCNFAKSVHGLCPHKRNPPP